MSVWIFPLSHLSCNPVLTLPLHANLAPLILKFSCNVENMAPVLSFT